MRVLGIDVETTVQKAERGLDNSPFNPENYLVSCGIHWLGEETGEYYFFNHNTAEYDAQASYKAVQQAIKEADILVGHNLKYDLLWLTETGFDIDCDYYCTMIGEYIFCPRAKTYSPIIVQ